MARQNTQQFNIRSAFVRERVREIAERTGMTATAIIEEALRAYVPPARTDPELPPERVGRLVRKGRLLVLPATPGARPITSEEVIAAIEADREERSDDVLNAGL